MLKPHLVPIPKKDAAWNRRAAHPSNAQTPANPLAHHQVQPTPQRRTLTTQPESAPQPVYDASPLRLHTPSPEPPHPTLKPKLIQHTPQHRIRMLRRKSAPRLLPTPKRILTRPRPIPLREVSQLSRRFHGKRSTMPRQHGPNPQPQLSQLPVRHRPSNAPERPSGHASGRDANQTPHPHQAKPKRLSGAPKAACESEPHSVTDATSADRFKCRKPLMASVKRRPGGQ
jgi:hypothetical protein